MTSHWATYLALILERRFRSRRNGFVQVDIVKDNSWILPSELKRDMLSDILDGIAPNPDSCRRSSGKRDTSDSRVLDQMRASRLSVAEHDVNHTRRQLSVLKDLGQD